MVKGGNKFLKTKQKGLTNIKATLVGILRIIPWNFKFQRK